MSSRMKTSRAEALMITALGLGLIAGVPTLIFIGFFTTIESQRLYSSSSHDAGIVATVCWLTLFAIFGLFTWRYIYKRNKLNKIFRGIQRDLDFKPLPENEMREFFSSAYFGIDPHRGTMLFIRLWKNNEVDVLGFNMSNWRRCELVGRNQLRIYLNSPEMPYIAIQDKNAWLLFERISVMRNMEYEYPNHYPGFVKSRAERLGEDLGFTMQIAMAR